MYHLLNSIEFRDVMLYVNSLKAPKNESITNHANL